MGAVDAPVVVAPECTQRQRRWLPRTRGSACTSAADPSLQLKGTAATVAASVSHRGRQPRMLPSGRQSRNRGKTAGRKRTRA